MALDKTAQRANAGGKTPGGRARLAFGSVGDFFASIGKVIWSGIVGIGKGIAWIWRTFWGAVFDTWNFVIRNIPIGVAIAAAAGLAAFEWPNEAKGWAAMFPGMDPWMYGAGAAGVICGYIFLFRRAREAKRNKGQGSQEFAGWAILTVLAFGACLFGIWSSTASNAVDKTQQAQDSRQEYAKLVSDRDFLAEKLETSNIAFFQAEIDERMRMIESLEGTAKGGYNLPDLSAETCKQNLPIGARRLCNRVNGGVDPFTNEETVGQRNLVQRLENSLEQATIDEQTLTDLNQAIGSYDLKKGDELQRAIADLVGEDQQFMARSIFYLAISGLIVFLSGVLWDYALEEIERKRVAARARVGKST